MNMPSLSQAHDSTSVDIVFAPQLVTEGTHRRWLAGLRMLLKLNHKPGMGRLRRLVRIAAP